jgi:GT2 family glycosyltransferase
VAVAEGGSARVEGSEPEGRILRELRTRGRGERPYTGGKFVFRRGEKLYLRGVTYGTFACGDVPPPDVVAGDFAAMAENGINAVRVYTVPPRWLLDLAQSHGLTVLVGIPWEQHVAFLDDRGRARSIEQRVREAVRACAGHPAVLAYAIGNEIPPSIVRWHGRRRVERFLERLYRAAKAEDPDGLVTYVNFPSTEYLQLPFVDLVCFNVYLEAEEQLEAYFARLQNLAGDRPLLITELGLDSRAQGEEAQAVAVGWQVRTAFAAGGAGAFVFSWTDDWSRAGEPVVDWSFGVTDRERRPKPALAALREAFCDVPVRSALDWPGISVVICSHNGGATIEESLRGATALDYPRYEVLVVDDGSHDDTAAIAARFPVRLIRTEHAGLSAARNAGLDAASGELVAYMDDDCVPDRDWLRYLAVTFMSTPHAAVGGPNVPPPDGPIAACVAEAPGGPTHVLVSDREAEHIPGCNMAFRKGVLDELGGFDPQFRVAGDDVDICWRLQDAGWTIGFSPAAMVWHRRRSSVRAYLRQQRAYGEAEGLLERKWPERYNLGGHLRWNGRVYGGSTPAIRPRQRWRIYYGTWGSGLFQSVYERAPSFLGSLPLMPEWYLALAALALLSVLQLAWSPLALELPGSEVPPAAVLAALGALATLGQALASGWRAFRNVPGSRRERTRLRLLTSALFLLQPVVRLKGRLHRGLTPWRRRPAIAHVPPWPRTLTLWSEKWQPPAKILLQLESDLRRIGTVVRRGGPFDRWDVEARVGTFGAARLRMAVEEHGRGRQFFRFRIWPRWSRFGVALELVLAALAAYGLVRGSLVPGLAFASVAVLLAVRIVRECAAATAAARAAIEEQADAEQGLEETLRRRAAAETARVRRVLEPVGIAEANE